MWAVDQKGLSRPQTTGVIKFDKNITDNPIKAPQLGSQYPLNPPPLDPQKKKQTPSSDQNKKKNPSQELTKKYPRRNILTERPRKTNLTRLVLHI